MPYVKQDFRKKYKEYAVALSKGNIVVHEFVDKVRKESLKDQDGILNYVITQASLFNPEVSSGIIEEIVLVFYRDPECYMMYNRMLGLFYALLFEGLRRSWYIPAWVWEIPKNIYNRVIGSYEEKKIKENGDLAV